MSKVSQRPFTGWHMTAILIAFFGVVVAVNFTMARYASATFGGIVVENSYVASQEFNGWLQNARTQDQLGWQAQANWQADGRIRLVISGAPTNIDIVATARHPLGRRPDRALHFARDGEGGYVSDSSLPAGRWILRLELSAGSQRWRHEKTL